MNKRNLYCCILILVIVKISFSQKVLKREVRAVWLTTAYNLDFPKSTNALYQKIDLSNIVEGLKNTNFNTIVFQASPRGNAFYKSNILPWAENLTGTLGKDPGYDPLAYLLELAHAKGIEVHAWVNAYKIYGSSNPPPITNPRHFIIDSTGNWNTKVFAKDKSGNYMTSEGVFLDPGNPEVRKHITEVAIDVARNYDIDGIHFDFIRYNANFIHGDASLYYSSAYNDSINGNPQRMERDVWQRYQVEKLLKDVHDSLKAFKPKLKIGVTIPGIYQGSRFGSSIGSSYLDIYRDCFIDPRSWLQKGYVDYTAPQIYWSITGKYPFTLLSADWNANRFNRHIWIGHAAYKVSDSDFGQFSEIENQLDFIRYMECAGSVFYRYGSLKNELGQDYTLVLKNNKYKTIANIPVMGWKDSIPPNPPTNLKIEYLYYGRYKISWKEPVPALDNDKIFSYNIYRVPGKVENIDLSNFNNIVANVGGMTTSYLDMVPDSTQVYSYTVTAFDRISNESIAPKGVCTGVSNGIYTGKGIYSLEQNYPNPFNSTTTIKINLGNPCNLDIIIYNTLGQEVKRIFDGRISAGSHQFQWNGTDNQGKLLPSGVYYYRAFIENPVEKNKNEILHKTMVILK